MKNHKNMQAVLSYPARQEPVEANSYSLYELPVIILLAAMNLMVWTLLMRFLA